MEKLLQKRLPLNQESLMQRDKGGRMSCRSEHCNSTPASRITLVREIPKTLEERREEVYEENY